ncbi:MAG: 2-hydroxychromene-2-carboxylate isomerase [Deltaproteobacteria bacterium]|nr:2-hydroxychromene-2-carboxylate isomerase [Deltaproteobacteria bacterium]
MREAVFYFDFISHNAYLAWTRLAALAERHQIEFELAPVVFGALLKAHGQLGPAEVPPKGLWMLRDVVRKAALEGIPIAPPHSHPFNPLLPLRIASLDLARGEQLRCVAALFEATWVRSLDVSDPQVVAATLSAAGFDGGALVERAGAAEVKAALRARTDGAIERGVFGVPSVWFEGVLFWGNDDLSNLDLHLRGEDPLTDVDFTPWLGVRPSVQRKR